MNIKRFSFENKLYKDDEWKEYVPDSNVRYKDGSAIAHENDENRFAIYDGGTNLMGDITVNGDIQFAGEESEYKRTFLESARDMLKSMV